MGTLARVSRQKISTTIASDTLSYLENLIRDREVRTLAEAIDFAIRKLLNYENCERLENDTREYFDKLSPEALEEESNLGAALAKSARGIDFDHQP